MTPWTAFPPVLPNIFSYQPPQIHEMSKTYVVKLLCKTPVQNFSQLQLGGALKIQVFYISISVHRINTKLGIIVDNAPLRISDEGVTDLTLGGTLMPV